MPELVVTRTVHIQAHPAAVWAALTQPALLSEWFGDSAELELSIGGTGLIGWPEWGDFSLVVEEIDEHRAFAWRWARDPGTEPVPGASTLVRFTLVETAGGTDLTVVETGWEDLSGDIPAAMEGNADGWRDELGELQALLEKQDSA